MIIDCFDFVLSVIGQVDNPLIFSCIALFVVWALILVVRRLILK